MKSKEEIDKIYLEVCKDSGSKEIASEYCGFTKGYLQCQEDMAKDLEMHILLNEHDWSRNPQAQLRDFINSINKQD